MIFFMPGFVGSELRLSTQRISDSHPTEGLHGFRVKRAWIWNQLSVEEEDPTPKIIGQVKQKNPGKNVFSENILLSSI